MVAFASPTKRPRSSRAKLLTSSENVIWPEHNQALLTPENADELQMARQLLLNVAKRMLQKHIDSRPIRMRDDGGFYYGHQIEGLHADAVNTMRELYVKADPTLDRHSVFDSDGWITRSRAYARDCMEAACRAVGAEYHLRQGEFGPLKKATTKNR